MSQRKLVKKSKAAAKAPGTKPRWEWEVKDQMQNARLVLPSRRAAEPKQNVQGLAIKVFILILMS
jgi:hypothetical protein